MTRKSLPAKAASPEKPEPSREEREAIEKGMERKLKRPVRAALSWTKVGGAPKIDVPHSDYDGGLALIGEYLATRSGDFAAVNLGHLDYVSRERGQARGETASGMNASLAIVQAIAPENELETALAVQMAGVHSLASELLGRAKQTDRTDHIMLYGGMAVKLTRTFTAQVEALAKLRGGGKQVVEVKHVYVNGNAVVGDVHAGGSGGGSNQTEPRPHAPGLPFAPGAPLLGEDAAGLAVPVACCEGAEALPAARREKPRRANRTRQRELSDGAPDEERG